MQRTRSTLALLLAVAALAVAGYGLMERGGSDADSDARLEELEEKVAVLTRAMGAEHARRPRLLGLDIPATTPAPGESSLPIESRPPAEVAEGEEVADASAEPDGRLRELVDAAVERKAEEMRIKAQNKKPSIELFASMMELTDEQREATEREVIRGQREVLGILDTLTYDGSNLLDELVENVAVSMAKPGTDPGWGGWIGRVVNEKVPGTDQTYGARIEAVKNAMRANFREIWSDAQYREFEAWGVDPTEIERIEGSSGEALRARVIDRARQLGWEGQDD